MTAFGDVRRQASLCPTRPVTPEVAGSSPVAPVLSHWFSSLSCVRQLTDVIREPDQSAERSGGRSAAVPTDRCDALDDVHRLRDVVVEARREETFAVSA